MEEELQELLLFLLFHLLVGEGVVEVELSLEVEEEA